MRKSGLARFASLVAEATAAAGPSAGCPAQARAELQALVRGFSSQPRPSTLPRDGKQLKDFLARPEPQTTVRNQYLDGGTLAQTPGRSVYIETYGCQMNVSDSEIVQSVLAGEGYTAAASAEEADIMLLNTCAIRERAEQRVWSRLGVLRHGYAQTAKKQPERRPIVGVLGCMAERLKEDLLRKGSGVDLVVGPDAYRDLPRLLSILQDAEEPQAQAMNVQLSLEETYADISPVRAAGQASAFVSIMRGCNNMCSFCIVPYTRGRERSRPLQSILAEVTALVDQGVKEVTLLGQNVNSYADGSLLDAPQPSKATADPYGAYAEGFRSVYKPQRAGRVSFADLLDAVAAVSPELRVRFTSPHPKEFSDEVLQVIAARPNVAKQLHMPAQSGSSRTLAAMRRGHDRPAYDALVHRVRQFVPQVSLSTDLISGFCGETEDDHQQTLHLVRSAGFDQAFMFAYSQRERTHAARHLQDDVPLDVKSRRLNEVIAAFRTGQAERNQAEIGSMHLVLVEGPARGDPSQMTGKTCTMKRVFFNAQHLPGPGRHPKAGDYLAVEVHGASATALLATSRHLTSVQGFVALYGSTVPPRQQQKLGEEACWQQRQVAHG